MYADTSAEPHHSAFMPQNLPYMPYAPVAHLKPRKAQSPELKKRYYKPHSPGYNPWQYAMPHYSYGSSYY